MTTTTLPAPAGRSLFGTLLVPIVALVGLACLLVAALGFHFGEQATRSLVSQLVAQASQGLHTHLRAFLDQAQTVTAVNATALQQGVLSPDRLFAEPEPWFAAQHRQFPQVDDIYFGRADGAIVGVDKAGSSLVLKLTTAFPTRHFYELAPNGQRGAALRSEPYDARERDWFKAAVAAKGAAWSRIYVLQNKAALGLSAARPVHGDGGRLLGVMGANLTLKSISEYLGSHPVGPNSLAYIVERDGTLVACSLPGMPLAQRAGSTVRRVAAGQAQDPLVAGSWSELQAAGAAPPGHAGPRVLDATIGQHAWRIYSSPVRDDLGLDWQVVIVVDPTQFMAGVRTVARSTLLAGALLLACLFLLVLRVTRRMAAPIQQLSQAAQQLAQGAQGQTVHSVGGGREIAGLVGAFNAMSLKLRDATAQISAHARHLEAEVAQRTLELRATNTALARARDQAQAENAAKSRFLADLSHEIRTPLNTIVGTCYLMRSDDATTQDRHLGALESASQHLLGVVNTVLDIAKIEAGRLELASGPVWIDALVANVLSMLNGTAAAKQIELCSRLAHLPGPLHGDAVRLQQMMLNLAANAVKFTHRGRVTLATRVLQESDASLTVRFDVHDNAPLLSHTAQARLFTPFEQGDGSAAQKQVGTGLGLAITRQLAGLMGGSAGAEPSAEGGNCFYFTARLGKSAPDGATDTPVPQSSAREALQRDFAGARVLVAEDEPVNLLITQSMLAKVGLVADKAGDGIQALSMAQATDYDLILLDLQMPGLDGLTVAHRLRESPRHAGTPIIATTANAFAEDRQRCLDAGMNDVLLKPMDMGAFFATLHRWLARG